MVATIEMPQVDTAPTQGDTATVLAAAKAKLAECKAVVDDWQAKYQQMEAETTSIEREAGERVLSGTLVADAGALIAAQRSAVAAIQRALDAAKRDREQAFIVMQRAKAADLQRRAAALEAVADRQRARFAALVDEIKAQDGFCAVTWRSGQLDDVHGLLVEAANATGDAARREAQLNRQHQVVS
jgi:hypothetical protein